MNERRTFEMNPEKFNRLPKWAQDRLNMLDDANARLRAKLSEGPGESEATLNPWSDTPVPLGKRIQIMFGEFGGSYFDLRYVDGRLVIHGNGSSINDKFVILPSAGNAVTLAILTDGEN